MESFGDASLHNLDKPMVPACWCSSIAVLIQGQLRLTCAEKKEKKKSLPVLSLSASHLMNFFFLVLWLESSCFHPFHFPSQNNEDGEGSRLSFLEDS